MQNSENEQVPVLQAPQDKGGKQPTSRPNATRTAAAITSAFCPGNRAAVLYASGNIMQNMQYQQLLQEYCQHYNDFELKGALRRWSEMRRKNGWVLGTWGLQVLLEKLAALGQEKISTMIAIVQQSIKRRWKGFHPLQLKSKPSGEKLFRLEEKEARFAAQQNRGKPLTVLKFKLEDEDLSFLEE